VLRKITASAAEFLRYGVSIYGAIAPNRHTALRFQCPGPCGTVHTIRPGQHDRVFDQRTQRLRCPTCRIELQLSILAEVLPPRGTTREGERAIEDRLRRERAARAVDQVPTPDQAAAIRRHQWRVDDDGAECA
jgi:hypothetical protein